MRRKKEFPELKFLYTFADDLVFQFLSQLEKVEIKRELGENHKQFPLL